MKWKYSKYKFSGIEWIGEIPDHWKVSRVGFVSELFTGFPWKSELFDFKEGIKIVRGENVSEGFLRWGERTRYWNRYVDENSIFFLKKGDIVISMDGSKVGKNYVLINESDLPLLLHQRMTRVRVGKLVSESFLSYFIGSEFFKYYIDITKTDPMIPHITQKDISDFKFSLPPIYEQTEIVKYLDEKTRQIDNLISITKKKIELLKEKRTSLINTIVTKGLNPNVELKDSGVEYIGKIPSHWEKRRVSTYGLFSKGNGIKKDEVKEIGFPCIRYGEIYTKYERVIYETVSFIDEETSKNSVTVKKGVVLFTGSGETIEDIGRTVVYFGESEVYVGGDIIILKLFEGIDPLFISYLMNSKYVNYQKSFSGRGEIIIHIYSKSIREIITYLPPLSEQNEIVKFLDNQIMGIDSLVSIELRRIEKLKEYRLCLISDVVTGKVRVYKEVSETKSVLQVN